MNKLLLIDGNSLAYRAYYGTAYSKAGVLRNKNGIPVNAIKTFNSIILKAFRTYNPTHVFIAFDAGKNTFRHEKLESYKDGRKKTPEDLIIQFPLIKEMIDLMGIKRLEIIGIEADDILGTLAINHSQDNEVFILSSDKDMLQLIRPNISMIIPQNGNNPDKIITIDNFYDQFGYYPNQVIDIKGILGDPSDNLPGVKGIGQKGAIKLITEYDTLENIYNNLEKFSDKTKEKLICSKEIAHLCKEIATLDLNVKIDISLKDMKYTNIYTKELINFFKRLEIFSLIKKYDQMLEKGEISEKIDNESYKNLVL